MVLVVALIQRGSLQPQTAELLSAGRSLADSEKQPLHAIVLGSKAQAFAQELIDRGADKVHVVEHQALDNFNDELHAQAVGELAEREKYGLVLLPSSVAGRALAGRLSVRLKAGVAAEVSEIAQNGTGLKAKRYQYGGNLISELNFGAPVKVVTLQAMVFPRAESKPGRSGEIVKAPFQPAASRIEFVSYQPEESNDLDLGAAERIVSGGRGLGTAEGFKLIRELAGAIGAAVGASRAVVDSGWIPYRHQVGLTGRSVRPKLYIACGISGQIQHLAGMTSSGTIVAINTDADCPMMQMATISVCGDINELIPLIVGEIKKRKGHA
ncbi:MAG: electron transfer flavoprotein subunit alpha/FixB family protein [Elusimicrobia bacterium]|nr:electron transfer flavoprotein subunit alpha/FixB family protein [Elusimicrobiota bacterium]